QVTPSCACPMGLRIYFMIGSNSIFPTGRIKCFIVSGRCAMENSMTVSLAADLAVRVFFRNKYGNYLTSKPENWALMSSENRSLGLTSAAQKKVSFSYFKAGVHFIYSGSCG